MCAKQHLLFKRLLFIHVQTAVANISFRQDLHYSLTLSVMSLSVDKQTICCQRGFNRNTQELNKDRVLKD